jgi:hypothetical protein
MIIRRQCYRCSNVSHNLDQFIVGSRVSSAAAGRARVRACVRVCVRARVCACVRVCACARAHARVFNRAHVTPQFRDLNQIQSTLCTFTHGPPKPDCGLASILLNSVSKTTSLKKIATQHSNKRQREQSGKRLPSSTVTSVRRPNLGS